MTKARFQVAENRHGYVVKDSTTGSSWTKTYNRLGFAVKAAIKLNCAHDPNYTDPAAR